MRRVPGLFLIVTGVLSLLAFCDFGYEIVRHNVEVYNGTFDVYRSNRSSFGYFFSGHDTVYGSFSVRNRKKVTLLIMNSLNYRRSPHDSVHSVFYAESTSYADYRFTTAVPDSFFLEFVNPDPESLRTVALVVNRIYRERRQ